MAKSLLRVLLPPRPPKATGTLVLALARPPRGARGPSRLIPQ